MLGPANARIGVVEPAESRPEGARPDDDRGDALFWYLHLLIENKIREGVPAAEIARRTGITKAQISTMLAGKPSGGVLSLIRFSKLTGMTPGEILDTALSWWEREGRPYRAATARRKAEETAAGKKSARTRSGLSKAVRADFEADVTDKLSKRGAGRPRSTGK
jgi:transcriptional regulator with XRE-family HTH domain